MNVWIGLAAVALACLTACSGPSHAEGPAGPSVPDGTVASGVRPAVSQVFSFRGSNGGYPYAGLTAVGGTLYGVTTGGCGSKAGGCIFSVTPSGSEVVLHAFNGSPDGSAPYASLNFYKGRLYGTTTAGGANGLGTVFSVTTSGRETVMHSFNGSDGSYPVARLTEVRGVLYGTTMGGGAHGLGTVFRVTTHGNESVVYSFRGRRDGASPESRLTDVGGVLYGTTYAGGDDENGTVFKVTLAGVETVVHRFHGVPDDGAKPAAGLANVGGILYGTTVLGGKSCSFGSVGCGTVFSTTGAGDEKVLHSFSGGYDDAANPYASLADVNGVLYGTASAGYEGCYYGYGCGAVFEVTASGSEAIVSGFGNGEGATPYGHLTAIGGTLYGTTFRGGALNEGTVFAVTPQR